MKLFKMRQNLCFQENRVADELTLMGQTNFKIPGTNIRPHETLKLNFSIKLFRCFVREELNYTENVYKNSFSKWACELIACG